MGWTQVSDTFSNVEAIWDAEISPTGERLALGCSYQDRRVVCVYDFASGEPPKIFPAPDNADLKDVYWASDDHIILVVDTVITERFDSGVEDIRIQRAISVNTQTDKSNILMRNQEFDTATGYIDAFRFSETKNVTMSSVYYRQRSSTGTRISNENLGYVYYAFNVNLETGKAKRAKQYNESVIDVLYRPDGEADILTVHNDQKGIFQILTQKKKALYEASRATLQPLAVEGYSADGQDLIVWSYGRNGIGHGVWRMSRADGELSRIKLGDFDVRGHSPIVDKYTNRVVGFRYSNGLSHQVYSDPEFDRYQTLLSGSFPEANVTLTSWSQDRSSIVVSVEKRGTPRSYYLFMPEGTQLSPIGSEVTGIEEAQLGTILDVRYEASDGLTIPGYLTLPPGKSREDGPFPTILMPHGGPEASDNASYDWWAQAYAASGYAVLQPNFRGSANFGQEFKEAGHGEFGGKMVTDVIDGLSWMEAEGLATPGGGCIAGASYGGYSALMAAILDNTKIRCAISVNGVTDPVGMVADGKRRGRKSSSIAYWEQYLGNILFASKDEQELVSPISRSREIAVPTLVLHGDEDTRVPFEQFEMLQSAASANGALSFGVLGGEDHFLFTKTARQAVLEQSLLFLEKHHPSRQTQSDN